LQRTGKAGSAQIPWFGQRHASRVARAKVEQLKNPMTIRIKATWFKPEQGKTAEQRASAVAFIAWRVAVDVVKRLRAAGYEVDAGPAYFGVVRELLVFLLTCADRLAYARLGEEARVPFTVALVRRVAQILADNEAELLGPPADGLDYAGRLVAQFDTLAEHYAEFGWREGEGEGKGEGPDLAYRRYLGSRLQAQLPERDRRWIGDQVIDIEAPYAVDLLQRAMAGVFSTEPRRPRHSAHSAMSRE
jgi:hypothetical protein